MKKSLILMGVMLGLFTGALNAQKIEVLSGSIESMSSVKFWELSIDYDELQITERKVSLGSEEDFKEKRMGEMESEDKSANWEKQYEEKKAKTFPNKFMITFNRIMVGDRGIMIATESYMDQVEGEVRVTAENLELGWKKGGRMGEALLTAKVEFYDQDGKLLLSLRLTDCPGVPSDTAWRNASDWYAATQRVSEAFAKCGKETAIYIDDNFPKKKKKK